MTALRLFGLAAAITTLVLAGLVAVRSARRDAVAVEVWRQPRVPESGAAEIDAVVEPAV